MNTKVLVVACLLPLCLIVPTAAISLEDDSSGAVEFEATSQYAEIDKNGKLRLDFQRLNKNAVTTVDETFEVQVNDESVRSVWIESEDKVSFYTGGDSKVQIDQQNPLNLDEGESETIGVAVDTPDDLTGIKTFTIHVEYEDQDDVDDSENPKEDEKEAISHGGNDSEPPEELIDEIKIRSATVHMQNETGAVGTDENITIEAGKRFFVDVTFENTGNTSHTFTGQLDIGGVVVDTQAIEIEAGKSKTVSFQTSVDTSGTYEVGANGQSVKSITIVEPDQQPSPGSRTLSSPVVAAAAPPAVGLSLLLVFSRDSKQTLVGLTNRSREAIQDLVQTLYWQDDEL